MTRRALNALAPRERKLLGLGAAAVLLFVLYLLLRGGGDVASPGVEIADAPPPAPIPQPAIYAAPPPVPVAVPAVPSGSLSNIVLAGVLAGGAAIFTEAGGNMQRVVRIGREVAPGATLKEVGLRHVLIATSGGDMRLEFGKSAQPQMASTAANVAAPAATSEREQTLQFQLALAPQRSNGRTIGYAIRKGADLPAFRGVGLQPGDVITGVNGSVLDEERLQELSWQIANSDRVQFDYSRGGRKMKAILRAAK